MGLRENFFKLLTGSNCHIVVGSSHMNCQRCHSFFKIIFLFHMFYVIYGCVCIYMLVLQTLVDVDRLIYSQDNYIYSGINYNHKYFLFILIKFKILIKENRN